MCWYGVDEQDTDPRFFLQHLAEAVTSKFPSAERPVDDAAAALAEPGAGWQGVVNRLVDWIEERVPEYFVLAIDDFHIAAQNAAATEALDHLVARLPDNCRLIVSTREIPQLESLPKLISQRKVAGLGAVELRFTPSEIRDLLTTHFDLEITVEEAHRLADESEGWITSILLTTHSLWKGLLRDVIVDRGRNTLLFEYIASEVFTQQGPEIQRFLLSTSVCDKYDVKLSETLAGPGAGDTLEVVESKNLFVTRLGGDQPWYQYHHLFRDFLREKLRKEDPPRFLSLNNAAAEYYLSLGDSRQAILYYIHGSEFERALELLEDLAEPLSHEGLWDTLGKWLDQIPEQHRITRPRLLLYLARVYQLRGKNDDAIIMLNDAISLFRDKGDRLLEAKALVIRSLSLRRKGAYQMAIRDAQAALSFSREQGSTADTADAHHHLGSAFAEQGCLPRAETHYKAAMDGYQQQGNLLQLSSINDRLGSIYNERGEFSKAATHFEQARQGWQKLGNQRELAVTLNNMAFLYYQQARFDAAEPLARESISLAEAAASPRDQAYALMTLSDTQREQGEYVKALKSCQMSLGLARQCMETYLVAYGSVMLGETYRLIGELGKARAVINDAIALAVEHGQEYEKALGLTALGIIEYEDKNYVESEASLTGACEGLRQSGQKLPLARACLHLAQALFLSKKYPAALDQLQNVAELCTDLGQEQFLVNETRNMHLLLQYGASKSKYRDIFLRLAERIDEQTPEDAPVPVAQADGARVAPAQDTRVEVSSLGSLSISLDGASVLSSAWGSAKAKEMFLLMLYRSNPLHKEKIVESLWPEIASSKANSNFHSTLYRMRRALYPNCVERDGELYQLNRSWTFWWDAQEFERVLAESARISDNGPEWEGLIASAIDLYRGPFLDEVDSEWCYETRIDLELRFLRAVRALAGRRSSQGDHQQSIDLLERALAVDDMQEELYYKIIEMYLELDDRPSADRVYRRCVSTFGEASPLADTQEVKSLLAQLS